MRSIWMSDSDTQNPEDMAGMAQALRGIGGLDAKSAQAAQR